MRAKGGLSRRAIPPRHECRGRPRKLMNSNSIDTQTARDILAEVSEAAQAGQAVFEEEAGIVRAAPALPTETSDVERQKAIERVQRIARARRQREQGIKELRKSYTGVMAVRREVSVNDPVIASTLQRYFGLIDRFYHIIGRRGPDIIGIEATEAFLGAMDERITEFSKDVRREADAASAMQKSDAAGSCFIRPEYTSHAAQEVVFAKHRKTLELLDALLAADRMLEDLNVMAWNGLIDPAKIEDARYAIKKQVAAIFTFGRKTMVGMWRKVSPDDVNAHAQSQAKITTEAANDVAVVE